MTMPIHVLFIEDNPGDARLVKEELRSVHSQTEIQLEWTDCLQKGLQHLQTNDIKVVLLDLSLPDSDGIETLQRVLAHASHIPVIVMTGQADEQVGIKALQTGAQDYLIKGQVDGRLLIRVIQYAIERKQAQAIVAATQKRFRALIEHAPDGIALLGMDGKLRQVTSSTQQILGYTVEESKDQDPVLLTHPDDLPALLGLLDQLILNPGKVIRTEYRFRHKDGSWRWLDSTITNLLAEPSVEAFVFNYRDITEQKKLERDIQERMKELRCLYEIQRAMQEKISLDQLCERISTHVVQAMQYPELAAVRIKLKEKEYCSPRCTPHLTNGLHTPIIIKGVPSGVLSVYYPEEQRFIIPEELNMLENIARSLARWVAQKQAEEEVALQANLLGAVGSAAIAIDLEGRVIYWNRAAENLYGWSASEAMGKVARELITTQESQEQAKQIREQLMAGNSWSGEFPVQRKDGSIFPAFVMDSPFLDASGALIGFIGISSDISELKQAQRALQEKEQLLSETQHVGQIGSLSYNIAGDRFQFSAEMYILLDISSQEFNHNRLSFQKLIYAADRPEVSKWMDMIVNGRQVQELDFRIFHQNGELRYLRCRGAVQFDREGKPLQFIGTVQDVTERRLAEIQIDQQINQLHALRRIDQAIVSGWERQATLELLLSEALSQLQVDAASILLLDSTMQALEYAAGKGFRFMLAETTRLSIGESHAGRVAKEKRMIQVPDLREKPGNSPLQALVEKEGFVSYIGVPLIVQGKTKGVLQVFHRSPLQPYVEWLDFLNLLAGQAVIAIENTALLANLRQTNRELLEAYDATIEGWSRAMDLRDGETEGHTQRVTSLTLRLARAMGIEDSQLLHIYRGALLHDLGKLGVPDHILFKAEHLTPEERQIMQKHPELACMMLAPIKYLKPALAIPYYHHEKWDGTGYPWGFHGEQIPLEARIFAVADVWDALTSERPYRPAWKKEDALTYIREQSGKHFDPQVVDLFFRIIEED